MKGLHFKKRAYFTARSLKKSGVKVCGDVLVSADSKIERGAELYGPCIVSGASEIRAGAKIMPFSHIENSLVGKGAVIRASTLINSRVGADCSVGPYAFLRAGADLGEGCRVGDFVEIKNSTLGAGCKAAHHAYIGDASLGKCVNVGCGVVFVNYDGTVKARSIVGDGCFIGCNCNIVAPVKLGAGAYVAAGSTVTRDLAPLDFCIARQREKVRPRGAEGRYKNGQILRD